MEVVLQLLQAEVPFFVAFLCKGRHFFVRNLFWVCDILFHQLQDLFGNELIVEEFS
jgi:hypothetical protein